MRYTKCILPSGRAIFDLDPIVLEVIGVVLEGCIWMCNSIPHADACDKLCASTIVGDRLHGIISVCL